ncbi:hypothetical protein JOD82_002108 [Paenibacillus sp. 1182]|uniref:hypothetical protein n=1 Tax=Paenibacillus sp. 1182 TaxID=2806565 RepID=UPI001AE895DA|nr:hypothetical protein [Paenibacillus sp. 1182]MBP1309088.1 hypothetical protein [Paenibacillus sp. 1182]
MYKIKVHLRNGKEIEICAKDFEFERSINGARFSAYRFGGITSHANIGFDIAEIVAYEAWEMTVDIPANEQRERARRVG